MQPIPNENNAHVVDGDFIYVLNESKGLIKAQFNQTNCPGKIVKINSEAKGQSMMLFKN